MGVWQHGCQPLVRRSSLRSSRVAGAKWVPPVSIACCRQAASRQVGCLYMSQRSIGGLSMLRHTIFLGTVAPVSLSITNCRPFCRLC